MFMSRLFICTLILPFLVACSGTEKNNNHGSVSKSSVGNLTRFELPEAETSYTLGESVPVQLAVPDSLAVDSIQYRINGVLVQTAYSRPFRYDWNSGGSAVGPIGIRAVTYFSNERSEGKNTRVILLAPSAPEKISYRVRKQYPHDVQAFTQGLEYHEGYLYEGTGNYGESSLRKVELETGRSVQFANLSADLFGEGITILNDQVYQLTYKARTGFVYEKESLRRVRQFYYQSYEGWGLTNDGEHLIMSDGSNILYFMEPQYFTEVRRIQVYNDQGPVGRLNELEYIEGKIFANIFGREEIIVIDPRTGAVTGRLDMQGIFPDKERQRGMDVFNGIAWNPEEELMYVTGKYWPLLFEIELLD